MPNWDAPTAAYIHIPFCRRRCFYCDFPISVVGDRPPLAKKLSNSAVIHSAIEYPALGAQSFGTIAAYISVLDQEIAATSPPVAAAQPLETIFFGGGTPSLLEVDQLSRILDRLAQQFGITTGAEISMEIDPGTFDLARLQGYVKAGVNRVSLGVQAFQTELLQACGRSHTVADVDQAIDLIHQVGVGNFSLDLISGLPYLTFEQWQESLAKAIALAPPHLSIYDLTIEPQTAFDRWYQAGSAPLPTEASTAEMYRVAQQQLTAAGYEHYEISNYARSGFQCRHNRVYWENRPYYGFGMAATSYVKQQRFTRPRKRSEYAAWVTDYVKTNGAIDGETTSLRERLLERLMLGLRLSEGLNLQRLRDQFGDGWVNQVLEIIQPYCGGENSEREDSEREEHWMVCDRHSVRFCDPEGFLFSNVVLADLFHQLAN